MNKMNTQKPEGPSHAVNGALGVIKVWSTIQGEGPLVGTPAVFVRLAGCNLECPLCDTNYTEGRARVPVQVLFDKINERPEQLVVLSGGEPMRQNIAPLVIALLHSGKHVQIETNGTFFVDLPFDDPMLTIVCSPKSPSLNERIVQHVDAWKYVVRAGCISDEDGLPLHALGNDFGVARPPIPVKRNEIFIQPLDEGSMAQEMIYASEHVKAALAVCVKHGYRLSIQTHKLLGLE